MSDPAKSVNEAAPPLERIPGLSERAARFARRHPRAAQVAVKIALETAASQVGINLDDDEPIPDRLIPFVVDRELKDTLTIADAAARLNVTRPTIYDWVDKGKLLAWPSQKRGLVIPAEQILGPRKVVTGLADVLRIIDDPQVAWIFLTQETAFEEEVMRPIDRLKQGEVRDVVETAAVYGEAIA